MKTAVQNLYQNLMDIPEIMNLPIYLIQKITTNCSKSLTEEKQQIIDAYNDGQEHGFNKFGSDAEKYYNETFKP